MGGTCSNPKVPVKERSPSPEVIPIEEKSPSPEVVVEPEPEPEPSIASSDDFHKTSDFEGFIIPFENDSDEIKIPPTEPNYPDPIPTLRDKKLKAADKIKWFEDWDPKTGSDDACNDDDIHINQTELDSHARKAPVSLYKSYTQLISYLEQPAKGHPRRDEIMVRSILVWLSNQVVENFTAEEGRQHTPFGFLSLLGQKRSTYSTFFTVLCRNANIVCAQIHGVCKAGDYQPGDRNELYTFWNAVYVNEIWQIIKPFWVCRSVFGKRSGGWIKLEASGKTIGQRETESAGVVRNAFQEYYIMPDPEQFIYRCHPDDKKWQLLPNPITRDTFFEHAYLLPPFWALGMRLLSQNSCSLTANGSTVTISFEAAKNIANELNMDYEFLLKEEKNQGQSENEMLQPQKIPRLVTKIRNASEWDFIIQFPIEGKYKIIIYGSPNQTPLLRLCEFELVCKKRTHACQLTPFDSGLLGFGPGPLSEHAGLLLPSHRNGLVTAEKDKQTKLRFLLDSDMSKTMAVKTELIDNNSNDQSKLVKSKIEKKSRELLITIKLIKDGDFGLRISTGKRTNNEDENDDMKVVCNYLITTALKFAREKTNQRLARQKLLAAIENGDILEIEQSIEKCLKEKIPENDSDIENAQRKLDVLRFRKDVRDAYMRRHLGTTLTTIQKIQKSMYERIFRETIRHLEEFAKELKSLDGFTQDLPSILSALTELNHTHVTNDAVVNTLMSLLVLFAKKDTDITCTEDIMAISREMTHMVRQEGASSIQHADAKKAQELLDKYTYEQTRSVSMAAAAIYKWIKDVIATVLKSDLEDGSDEA